MNCAEYQNLTPLEKSQYIGELVHACISDTKYFKMGEKLIKQAQDKGLFEGVVINPPSEVPPITENQNEIK